MNFCILGIGNVGEKYENTKHNTGFILLDQFAKNHECEFSLKKHAYVTNFSLHSHNFIFKTNNIRQSKRYCFELLDGKTKSKSRKYSDHC